MKAAPFDGTVADKAQTVRDPESGLGTEPTTRFRTIVHEKDLFEDHAGALAQVDATPLSRLVRADQEIHQPQVRPFREERAPSIRIAILNRKRFDPNEVRLPCLDDTAGAHTPQYNPLPGGPDHPDPRP